VVSGNGSGIYNLGVGRGTSVNEIFSTLQKVTGYRKSPVHGPAKLGETRRIYLDSSKARQQLGWTPTVGLEEGLERTVAYFKASERLA
jgi:UDP-glucose 4-epimerase